MSLQQFEKKKIHAPFLGEPLVHIVGQDPLGLLNTGNRTFDLLLPGLNNVTDRIRYYSFYCWFFHIYAKYVGKPAKKEQFDYLRRAEFILALLAAKQKLQGIGGITKAMEIFDNSSEAFDLTVGTGEHKRLKDGTYWKNPRGIFGQNYVSSLKQLNLIRESEQDSGIFIRTDFEHPNSISGLKLAEAFEKNIGQENSTIFITAMINGILTQDDIISLIPKFNMLTVPTGSAEHEIIWKLLTGEDEPKLAKATFFRKKSIQLILEGVSLSKGAFFDQQFTIGAYNAKGQINGSVDETLSLWYFYQLEQYWHMACTGSLFSVLEFLRHQSHGGWIDEDNFVTDITQRTITFLREAFGYKGKTFEDIELLGDNEDEMVIMTMTHKNAHAKLACNILLIKQMILSNKPHQSEISLLANRWSLNSKSSFVNSVALLEKIAHLPIEDFIIYFIKKYVIVRHQWVALQKMNASQSTEKLIREDGYIRFIDGIDYNYSSPRINTLLSFLKDMDIISKETLKISDLGGRLLKNLQHDQQA
ncbi:MAG: hypothetical protein DI539_00855 [Flavobacterium psychrophilum]|nr:MAG: hypothetical protein DI539_00855 [Flavobacterium psychrophilum]